MQSSLPPSYAEVTLQDLPELSHILTRGEFLVYSRNYKGKHEVKSSDKILLCVGKWKREGSIFSSGPSVSNLIVKTVDKKEVLSMSRTIEGLFRKKGKVFEMTAIPQTHLGRIIKDEQHHYQMHDSADQVVLHIQKIVKVLSRTHYKVLTPDGKEIGTIGDNNGSKHVLQIPASLPLSHKALLLGFTLSVQDAYDDDQQAAATSSSASASAVAVT